MATQVASVHIPDALYDTFSSEVLGLKQTCQDTRASMNWLIIDRNEGAFHALQKVEGVMIDIELSSDEIRLWSMIELASKTPETPQTIDVVDDILKVLESGHENLPGTALFASRYFEDKFSEQFTGRTVIEMLDNEEIMLVAGEDGLKNVLRIKSSR